MKRFLLILVSAVVICLGADARAEFKEYPAGEEQVINHMKIAAVYLAPVSMEPRGAGVPASKSEVHLEADIHATRGNPNGFGAGEWIPYLTVNFELTNVDTGEVQKGTFMPMIAQDGPHYGLNINMMGAGNYKLVYTIDSPDKQGLVRHTDPDSGVGKWFQPFTVEFEFKYVPIK